MSPTGYSGSTSTLAEWPASPAAGGCTPTTCRWPPDLRASMMAMVGGMGLAQRIIGGADPIELGKNNSGRWVGGSMVHYAGYTPAFTQRSVHLYRRRRGRGLADRVRRPAPALRAGGGRATGGRSGLAVGLPAPLPASPHPGSGAADKLPEGALRCGIEPPSPISSVAPRWPALRSTASSTRTSAPRRRPTSSSP